MLDHPVLFLLLTTASLGIWFWRSNKRDASLWMYGTYGGAFLLALSHYQSMTALSEGLPLVVRDFLLIGIAGFLQSLAVAKRITIWQAVVGIGIIYGLVYLLPFESDPNSLATEANSPATSLVTENSSDESDNLRFSSPDPDGEYLIEKSPGVSEEALFQWALSQDYGISKAFTMADEAATELDEFYVLDVPRADQATFAAIQTSDLTAWVEDNEMVSVDLGLPVPNVSRREVPLFDDPEAEKQWAIEVMDLTAYFKLLQGLEPVKKVRIAILDTGVDAQHEDLEGNYVSTQKQYDNDPRGHGTHCAGIAAGVTNNGIGIASLAGSGKLVEITSIKVLSAGGGGTQKTIIQGMLEAADSGADIISMSLGGYSNSSRQRAYNQAISYARRNNAIVIAAAGNSNREATGFSPANGAGAICVAAMDELSLRAPFSNRVGKIKMAVAAPGVSIHSTFPNNNYKSFSGTSMACPFVAGLVAVMRSQRPELTADEAYQILANTGKRTSEVDQLGPIVQPAAALRAVLY